ncbi:MAG: T9SS type A sorting domain-containing protein [Saprospiraceae bacterium]
MKTRLLTLALGLMLHFNLSSAPSEGIKGLKSSNFVAELACNDLINISLDTTCSVTVNIFMLLEGPIGPISDYLIQIWNGDTLQLDLNFNATDLHRTYTFKVFHLPSGNSCWGKIHVEDKLAPTMQCSNDTLRCGANISPYILGFPIPAYFSPSIKPCINVSNCFEVDDWDYCCPSYLTYTDDVRVLDCDSMFSKVIIRCWRVIDLSGNKAVCYDSIFIKKADFSDIVIPPDYDGTVRPHINCNDLYPKLPNGNPDPSYTGFPIPDGCNKLVASYKDLKFVICETSYKIIRRWTIIDWCTKNIREINQVIKVIDDQAPTFFVPANISLGMKTYSCGSYGKLPIPTQVSDCGSWKYIVYSRQIDSFGNPSPVSSNFITYNKTENIYYLDGAPEGRIWIYYEVSDLCGNISSQQIEVAVIDQLLPIPICDQKTVVSLTSNGTARILAETFDDGSIDNCGIFDFKARRMDDPCGNGTNVFGDYVDFCCEDIGKTVMVALEVIDNSRNKNTCMVEVIVQEKEAPQIVAPTDITISCSFDISDLSVFGSVRLSESERKQIIIKDTYYSGPNYIAGIDGLATDNCFVEVRDSVNKNLICNQGTITRTFIAKDRQGLISTAVQTIFVRNPNPFNAGNIVWPFDRRLFTCRNADIHPNITGSPIYFNQNCATIAANYEDKLLSKVDSSCYKIFRKWTVVDWCQFNAQTNAGVWEHVQILYIENSNPPDLLSCNTLEICDFNSYYDPQRKSCMVNYNITGDAEDDCTHKDLLKWSYRLDEDRNGSFETLLQGNHLIGVRPVGEFTIRWIVEDACGNISTCDQLIILKDCKKPTPYCVNGITTVVMPINGTVTVWAKDLNINSFDNCTQKSNLIFSFSSDIRDTSVIYNCDSLNKQIVVTKNVRIYVTDESGNQDFCETTIKIQDNNKVCGGTFANLSGVISRNDKTAVPFATINIVNDKNEKMEETTADLNGKYSFQNIPMNSEFKMVASKEDEILNGVTTFDIILIQKNILGKSIFSSPFQFLAADVNNSHSVTSKDISDIRKVILGVTNEFPSKKIWSFIPASTQFSDITSPWNVKEDLEFKNLTSELDALDYVGIKKGDVDNSAEMGFNQKAFSRNSTKSWIIGDALINNDHFLYPVYINENIDLEGFQLGINITGLISVVSASLDIIESNYSIQGNRMNMSWNTNETMKLHSNEVLFYIETSSKGSNFELMDHKEFSSEIYTSTEVNQLIITRSNNIVDDYKFELGQNIPNPYYDHTVIPIEVTKSVSLRLTIYEVTGKLVMNKLLFLNKGMNYVNLEKSELGTDGIYLYKIEGAKGSQVRKMVLKF